MRTGLARTHSRKLRQNGTLRTDVGHGFQVHPKDQVAASQGTPVVPGQSGNRFGGHTVQSTAPPYPGRSAAHWQGGSQRVPRAPEARQPRDLAAPAAGTRRGVLAPAGFDRLGRRRNDQRSSGRRPVRSQGTPGKAVARRQGRPVTVTGASAPARKRALGRPKRLGGRSRRTLPNQSTASWLQDLRIEQALVVVSGRRLASPAALVRRRHSEPYEDRTGSPRIHHQAKPLHVALQVDPLGSSLLRGEAQVGSAVSPRHAAGRSREGGWSRRAPLPDSLARQRDGFRPGAGMRRDTPAQHTSVRCRRTLRHRRSRRRSAAWWTGSSPQMAKPKGASGAGLTEMSGRRYGLRNG